MQVYDFIVSFVGTLPEEFTFIYAILTLLFMFLVISVLFGVLFLPFKLLTR